MLNNFILGYNFWYNLFNIIYTITMCWSWGIELGYHQKEKNFLEVADLPPNQCAWGSINSERLYWGIQ